METVTESTMAIESTISSILNEIQHSKLNFAIQLTPYAAYITLKRSTQVDKNGVHAIPSPPIFLLLQKSFQDLHVAREQITYLENTLKESESANKSLLSKL